WSSSEREASRFSRSGRWRRSRSLLERLPLLEGRAHVVTGASRGIGRAIASRLTAFGADVLAVSRGGDGPASGGGRMVWTAVALRDPETPTQLLAAALDAFGRVDGLVNNAGVIHFADCWLHGDEEWNELFETNLTAPFRLGQAFACHWIGAGQEGV